MKTIAKYGLYIFLGLFAFTACNSEQPQFEKIVPISAGIWDKDEIVAITMPVEDSLQYYNLQIYIRNRDDYPYSNLYLFVTVTAPTGATVTDTIQYILADNNGKWLGKGFSKLWDNRFPYRSNVRFANKGNYLFMIRHGMREEELPGITDVGIRLVEE